LRTHVHREKVLQVSSQNASTLSPAFANRLEYSKEEKKIVITLHSLQKNDSDIYVCARVETNGSFLSANGSGTMMLITGNEEQRNCPNSSWGIYGLIIVVVLLSSALICCTLYRVNMKKCFQERSPNSVYEDMSYTSRCNTLVR
ncbi:CD7 protein, partial [Galbula dea]|nr:CD7 protein [Galbula dea]